MSSSLFSEQLSTVAQRVLEDAAFVFTEEVSTRPRFTGTPIEMRIEISGDHVGWIGMLTYADFGAQLVADMLGEDATEATQDQATEALGETLNMIVGPLLETLFGASAICDLGPPQLTQKASQHDTEKDLSRAWLVTDDETPIELKISIDDPRTKGETP